MGYCKTREERIPLRDVTVTLISEHGELERVSDRDGRFGFVLDEVREFTLYVTPPPGWLWSGMTHDSFWDDWVLWFDRPERYELPVYKSEIGTYALGETWFLPDIWNEVKHPPTVDPALYPPTFTPWATKTATPTETPMPTETLMPTATATLWPTKTRIPWPEGEVPSEIPHDVWLGVLEMTRNARRIEGWDEVRDDMLVALAGNNSYGAQLSPIVTFYDDAGNAWRGMDTCQGLLLEAPDGWVWFLKGYSGPVMQVWPTN